MTLDNSGTEKLCFSGQRHGADTSSRLVACSTDQLEWKTATTTITNSVGGTNKEIKVIINK